VIFAKRLRHVPAGSEQFAVTLKHHRQRNLGKTSAEFSADVAVIEDHPILDAPLIARAERIARRGNISLFRKSNTN
jgi:hypothetical protein